MPYRTILVELAGDSGLEPRLQVARSLADRFQATLIGMHVMPLPFIPASYGEAAVYMIEPHAAQGEWEVAERGQATFRSVCGEGPSTMWQEAEGDRGDLLAVAARTTDLLLASLPGTGVPIVALPPEASGDLGQTVLVAWNGSREATRAVHDALPLLNAAKGVTLCAVGDEAATSLEAAAAMLRRHGIAVHPHRVAEPDGNAGEVLLAECSARGADLLVMGAYGHARLRELVFGGATRHVLRAATLPVLFGS